MVVTSLYFEKSSEMPACFYVGIFFVKVFGVGQLIKVG